MSAQQRSFTQVDHVHKNVQMAKNLQDYQVQKFEQLQKANQS